MLPKIYKIEYSRIKVGPSPFVLWCLLCQNLDAIRRLFH